jgi:EAL domain-containing protein (putative c-di-GMP-specific phosphodiesterase class I)
LKIDRSFVQGLGDGSINLPIVRNILQLAESLGMRVVAEGIETAEDASVLHKLGCDFGQGYAFGRPQPIDYCAAFVRSWKSSGVTAWNSLPGKVVANVA